MKRAAIILLLAALITAVIYYALRKKPEPAADSIPELALLVPKDVIGIAYVDFAAVRASQFWKDAAALLPAQERDDDFKRFVADTGFDYERDLDRAVVVWRAPNAPATQLRGLALAEGRFDRAKIRAYAARNGKIEGAGGGEVFRFVEKSESRKDLLVAFLSDARVALAEADASSEAEFRTFIQSPPSALPFEEKLQAHIHQVAGGAAFAVTRVTGTARREPSERDWLSDQMRSLQGSVDWLTFGARPDGDRLKLLLEAEADGTWKAMQLGVLLDGFKIMATSALKNPDSRTDLTPKENEALLRLLEKTATARDGNRVQVRMDLTQELVRTFADRAQREKTRSTSPEPRNR